MPNEPVLVDTGPLVALFNPNDRHHEDCKRAARDLPVGKTFTCWPVIVEASYMLRHFPEKRDGLLDAVQSGDFQLLRLASDDIAAVREILKKYADQTVDLADASLLYLADRESIDDVFTIDRHHFGVFRKKNGKPLRMIPTP